MRGFLAARPRSLSKVLGVALFLGASSASAATIPAAGFVTAPAPASIAPPTQGGVTSPFRLNFAGPAALPVEGSYITNDVPSFMIDRLGGQVRMRFMGSDEVFYLASEPASLGGRILRFDTGDIALTVAGWGGVTLYTDEIPWGIPAEHLTAAAAPIDPKPVAARDVRPLADKLSRDVAQHGAFSVGFSTDWDGLARLAEPERALAIDSMRNAAYALEQMANEAAHAAIAKGLHTVRVTPAAQPGVAVQRDSLIVSYSPQGGPSARPSSLAIAQALQEAF